MNPRKKLLAMWLMVSMVALCCFTPALAAKPNKFFLPGIRPLGMGGAFLALSDDQNAFFYNPAGITQRLRPLLSVADLTLQTNQSGYELGQYILDLYTGGAPLDPMELLSYFSQLLEENFYSLKYNMYALPLANIALIAPPMGYLSVGLGAYVSALNAEFALSMPGLIPEVGLNASVDSGLIIPIAYDLGEKVAVGVNLKAINRNNIDVNMSLLDLLNLELPNADIGYGYGFDAGILMHLGGQLSVGATLKDIGYTNITYYKTTSITKNPDNTLDIGLADLPVPVTEKIEPTLDVGFAYLFTSEQLPMGDNILFTCQYDDLTGRMEDAGYGELAFRPKNLHLGIELSYQMVSFRAGINQGYGTAGLGVYLGPLCLDYAFYGQELGLNAGDIPQWNHIVSLALRLR